MYKGKECCQGCGKSGEEVPRGDKNALCYPCKDLINLGKSVGTEKELANSYLYVFQPHHAFHRPEVNALAHNILSALNNPSIQKAEGHNSLKSAFGSNGLSYKIPKQAFEPLQKFFSELDQKTWDLNKEIEDLPNKSKQAVRDEKNAIFNAGVGKGRR